MRALPDPAIQLARRQFGCVGRFQLLRWCTTGQVSGLVERGTLEVVERGVYRLRGGAVVPEQAPMAAVLRARPKARVTGPFVLGLLDVDGFTTADPFEILRQPDRRIRNVGFRHRVDPTPGVDSAWVQGLPIAGPTSALVDSWRFLHQIGERRLRVGLDSARWRRLTSTDRILERARQLGPRDPGAAAILDRHSDGTVRPESAGERGLGDILRGFRPPPEPQVWVTPRRRVDWFWRILRLAVEYEGDIDHGHEVGRRRDAARADELEEVGVRIVHVTPADLVDAAGCAAWLASVCVLRARELGVPAPVLL